MWKLPSICLFFISVLLIEDRSISYFQHIKYCTHGVYTAVNTKRTWIGFILNNLDTTLRYITISDLICAYIFGGHIDMEIILSNSLLKL